jgi:putative flippase GtrA
MFDSRKQASQRPGLIRWLKFNAVGAAGVLVQLSTLAYLCSVARINYLIATVIAVESAILHNFAWHYRWTWGDRRSSGHSNESFRRLLRFNMSVGAVSIGGNAAVMSLLVGRFGVNEVLSNIAAIVLCSVVNFFVNDRWVFTPAIERVSR